MSAKKAASVLAGEVAAHQEVLAAGIVPEAGLRKTAEKYLRLLDTLDIQDPLLTPEALKAIHAEHEEPVLPPALRVEVSREDLALLTSVVASQYPGPADGTPLGRLMAAAVPGPDPGFPPQGS